MAWICVLSFAIWAKQISESPLSCWRCLRKIRLNAFEWSKTVCGTEYSQTCLSDRFCFPVSVVDPCGTACCQICPFPQSDHCLEPNKRACCIQCCCTCRFGKCDFRPLLWLPVINIKLCLILECSKIVSLVGCGRERQNPATLHRRLIPDGSLNLHRGWVGRFL